MYKHIYENVWQIWIKQDYPSINLSKSHRDLDSLDHILIPMILHVKLRKFNVGQIFLWCAAGYQK